MPPVSSRSFHLNLPETISKIETSSDHTRAKITLSNGASYIFTVYKGAGMVAMHENDWRDIANKTIDVLKNNGLPIGSITDKATVHLGAGEERIETSGKSPVRITHPQSFSALQKKINEFGPEYIVNHPPPISESGELVRPKPLPDRPPTTVHPQALGGQVSIARQARSGHPPPFLLDEEDEQTRSSPLSPVRGDIPHLIEPEPFSPKPLKLGKGDLSALGRVEFTYKGNRFQSIDQAFKSELAKGDVALQGDEEHRFGIMYDVVKTAAKENIIFRGTILEAMRGREIPSLPGMQDFTRALAAYRDREIYLGKVDELQRDNGVLVVKKEVLSPQEGTSYVQQHFFDLPKHPVEENYPEIFFKDYPRNLPKITVNQRSFKSGDLRPESESRSRSELGQAIHEALGKDSNVTYNAMKFPIQDALGDILLKSFPSFTLMSNRDFITNIATPVTLHSIEDNGDRVKFKSKILVKLERSVVYPTEPLRYRWVSQEVDISKEELRTGKATNPIVTRLYTPFFETQEKATEFALANGVVAPYENYNWTQGSPSPSSPEVGRNIRFSEGVKTNDGLQQKPKRSENVGAREVDPQEVNAKVLVGMVANNQELLAEWEKIRNKSIDEIEDQDTDEFDDLVDQEVVKLTNLLKVKGGAELSEKLRAIEDDIVITAGRDGLPPHWGFTVIQVGGGQQVSAGFNILGRALMRLHEEIRGG